MGDFVYEKVTDPSLKTVMDDVMGPDEYATVMIKICKPDFGKAKTPDKETGAGDKQE